MPIDYHLIRGTLSPTQKAKHFGLVDKSLVGDSEANRKYRVDSNEASKQSKESKSDRPPTNAIEATPEPLDYIPKPLTDYKPLAFEHSLEMLAYVDENIKAGLITFHPWQVEMSLLLCHNDKIFTAKDPLKLYICAANGSGKDAYINAPWALWFIATKARSKVIITSASYMQLFAQTENYIRSTARLYNQALAAQGVCEKAFTVKKEYVRCELTGSEIIMFVTDDPARAEGHHPYPDNPNGKLAIIANEAKSIPDTIFEALARCTFTHWLEVSTPGDTSGHFYKNFSRAIQYPATFIPGKRYSRRITSYDCVHISRSKIEEDKEEFGETSALFRSKHLALFTPLESSVVLTRDALDACLMANYDELEGKRTRRINLGIGLHAGLDLASGGDENALYVFDDNVFVGKETFQIVDTDVTVKLLDMFFRKYGLEEDDIFADDGGVGHPMLDNLRANYGWNVNRVLNQSAPARRMEYANLGTENWFRFARLVQEKLIILPEHDTKLHEQLCNRRFQQNERTKKIMLEPKIQARVAGRVSPDRADSCVLAFINVSISMFRDRDSRPNASLGARIYNQKELEQVMHKKKFEFLRSREQEFIGNSNSFTPGTILRSIYYGK